jgi:predicted nucleic acid-binding Zn ribbon protein
MKASTAQINARVDTHEAVCEERYANLNKRLQRLENIVIGTAGATILLLLSLVTMQL